MFGMGTGELVLIGVVALIVVGPKELPMLFRNIGRFTGKARGMAREFSRAMEAAADEAGVKDIDRTIRAAAEPMKSAGSALRDLTGLKDAPKTRGEALAKPTGATPAAPAASAASTETSSTGSVTGPATAELAAKRNEERSAATRSATEKAAAAAAPAPASTAPADTPIEEKP